MARGTRRRQPKERQYDENSKIGLDESINDDEIEVSPDTKKIELWVRFPKLKCYKKAFTDLINTTKPVRINSNFSFTTSYNSRSETEEFLNNSDLQKLEESGIKLKLAKDGEPIPKKRVVIVPRRAHYREACDVLKKVYGAKEIEVTRKGIDNHEYVMEFDSEEDAVKAENREHVIYHGLELVLGAAIGPKKRPTVTESAENSAAKKLKEEDANGNAEEVTEEKTSKRRNQKQVRDEDVDDDVDDDDEKGEADMEQENIEEVDMDEDVE